MLNYYGNILKIRFHKDKDRGIICTTFLKHKYDKKCIPRSAPISLNFLTPLDGP